LSIDDRIEATRITFSDCYFDEKACEVGLNALINYKKKWDPVRQIYSNEPIHDWASHGSDSFGYLCVAVTKKRPQIKVKTTEQLLQELKEKQQEGLIQLAYQKKTHNEDSGLEYIDESVF
jgi:hypothetical protein